MSISLPELLLDQERRWMKNDPMLVEAYLASYPGLENDPDAIVSLAYKEFILRERRGESPQVSEFLARLPIVAEILERQLRLYLAVKAEELKDLQSASGAES